MKWAVGLLILLTVVLIAAAPPAMEEARYLSPSELALSPDGRWLYVICEKSDELLVTTYAASRLVSFDREMVRDLVSPDIRATLNELDLTTEDIDHISPH